MPYLAQPSQTCAFPPSFVFKTLCLPSLFFVFLFLRDIVSVACQAWSCDTYFCFIIEYTPQNILSLSGKVTLQYGGKRDVLYSISFVCCHLSSQLAGFIETKKSDREHLLWWLKVHVSIHKIRKNDWKVFLSSYNITLSIFTWGKNGAIVSPAVWRHNQRYRGKQFFPDLLCFRIPAFHICPRKSYAKVSVAVLSHNQRYSGRQFFPDLLCFRIRSSFCICSRKNHAKVSVALLSHNERHSGRKLDAEDLFVPGTTILGGWRGLWDDRINRAGIRHWGLS